MQAIITVGQNFGDESKGSAVEWLSEYYRADLVVRYNGGHQAAHNVVLENGKYHTFAQFGSATLLGVPTFLGPHMIIEPLAMAREAQHLMELGVTNPFNMMTIDPDCLITTPFHVILGQSYEMQNKHGSVGVGIGKTRELWLRQNLALKAKHYINSDKNERLSILDEIKQKSLLLFSEKLRSGHDGNMTKLRNWNLVNLDNSIMNIMSKVKIAHIDHFSNANCIVFEGAQGVLLDEYIGFHPHTTWSNTTTHYAEELCSQIGNIDKEIIGITRTYMTRHGNGPLPTETKLFKMLNGIELNPDGVWTGKMRFGWFDQTMYKYSITHQPVDYVFLTHIDNDQNKVVTKYAYPALQRGIINDSIQYYFSAKSRNSYVTSVLDMVRMKEIIDDSAYNTIENMGLKVKYVSSGPTRKDKKCLL